MSPPVFRIVALVCALFGLLVPAGAQAREALFARSCVLPSERPLTLAEAQTQRHWRCGPSADDTKAPYLWIAVGAERLPRGQGQRLEGDAMPSAGLTTVLRFADGSTRAIRFNASALAHHWTAGTRFSVWLYGADERPTALFIRVDRPFDRQVATELELHESGEARDSQLRRMVMFGVFTGMLLVIALYSLSLFVALRRRFALAHALMTGFLVQYTFASSSLIFLVFPGASLWLRTGLAYTGLAGSMALLAPFLSSMLERDALTPAMRRLACGSGALVALAGIAVPLLGPQLPFITRLAYTISFVPGLIVLVALCAQAWLRGSRAVRLVALAWLWPSLAALDRILRALELYSLPPDADFAIFGAMAFQSVFMAFAIAWRVGEIRKERDRALATQRTLTAQVGTDALTGLPNRRAFQERHWRCGDYIAVVDVDRFKRVNDRHGHMVGDAVLQALAAEMRAEVEAGSLIGAWRLGGEEFVVLVAARNVAGAALLVNRLRERISGRISGAVADLLHPVTVSAGLAEIRESGIADAYDAADRALYHAKASGRDRLSWEAADKQTATIFPRRSGLRAAA
jgi:diguanylate cyclase (GGDEF)-like protein